MIFFFHTDFAIYMVSLDISMTDLEILILLIYSWSLPVGVCQVQGLQLAYNRPSQKTLCLYYWVLFNNLNNIVTIWSISRKFLLFLSFVVMLCIIVGLFWLIRIKIEVFKRKITKKMSTMRWKRKILAYESAPTNQCVLQIMWNHNTS